MTIEQTRTSPKALPLPPGPRGLAYFKAVWGLLRDPKYYPARLVAEYGDIIWFHAPFMPIVFVNHPDYLTHVAVHAIDRYKRGRKNAENMRVQGSPYHVSFFEEDDDEWRRGRKVMQPHFTQKSISGLGSLVSEIVQEEVAGWATKMGPDGTLEFVPEMKELALRVFYGALFSRRISDDEMRNLERALDDRMAAFTVRQFTSWWPTWAPRPLQRRGAKGDAWLDRHLAQVIAERRATPAEEPDLLDALLNAHYDNGDLLPDAKTRTEMLFLVIGGHETTAAALAWTFSFLATHPEASERVRDEVDSVLGSRPPVPSDMLKLKYTKACFDEAMRLQGGLVINPKQAIVDNEMGGYRIPAGATIMHSNLLLQRDPRFWSPEPNAFRPERWLESDINKAAYQIFGQGPRMCLGKLLAAAEAVLTIATAFQHYQITAPPGWEPKHKYRGSMTVADGAPLQLTPR